MNNFVKINYLEVGSVAIALVIACLFSNNDMALRHCVPLLPVLIGICSLSFRLLSGKAEMDKSAGLLLLLMTGGYFSVRALLSGSESAGEKDFMLFSSALLTGIIFLEKGNRRVLYKWIPWLAIILITLQSIPVLIQLEEPSYVPFREVFPNKEYISGFFGHQNFFAALISICVLSLLSYLLFDNKASVSRADFIKKVIWFIFILWGAILIYLAHSRGVLMASAIAFSGVFFFHFLYVFISDSKRKKLIGGSYLALCVAFITIVYLSFSYVAEKRTEGNFFFHNSRLDMLLLSADSAPENKMLGGGARFFKYEARRVWDENRLNNSLGDPEYVHNEYVEALVNYGYLGALLLLLFLVLGASYAVSRMLMYAYLSRFKKEHSEELAISAFSLAILILFSVQMLVDFPLHILPLICIFTVACVLNISSNQIIKKPTSVILGVLIVSFMSLTLWKTLPYWLGVIKFETARASYTQGSLESAELYKEVGESTGNAPSLLKAAHKFYALGMSEQPPNLELLQKSIEASMLGERYSPQDGEFNYTKGRALLHLQDYEKASETLLKGAKKSGVFEQRYKLKYLAGVAKYLHFKRERQNSAKDKYTLKELYGKYKECAELIERKKIVFYVPKGYYSELNKEIFAHHHLFSALMLQDRSARDGSMSKSEKRQENIKALEELKKAKQFFISNGDKAFIANFEDQLEKSMKKE